ncbi:hypothetical protein NDU88_004972 [Pleurodeles waltl]|uniref:Uncharacterized protein n=1 Tax=Pleurodeles waltl TaxID=8319 RepID=A0AAV7W6H6_PLEWA|nr:hypothetical protein NDU88_004972 [Pleurodeles waltl]
MLKSRHNSGELRRSRYPQEGFLTSKKVMEEGCEEMGPNPTTYLAQIPKSTLPAPDTSGTPAVEREK